MVKTGRGSGLPSAANSLKQDYERHNDRVVLFKFMAEHIIPNETFILDENDLRKLEVLPQYDY